MVLNFFRISPPPHICMGFSSFSLSNKSSPWSTKTFTKFHLISRHSVSFYNVRIHRSYWPVIHTKTATDVHFVSDIIYLYNISATAKYTTKRSLNLRLKMFLSFPDFTRNTSVPILNKTLIPVNWEQKDSATIQL